MILEEERSFQFTAEDFLKINLSAMHLIKDILRMKLSPLLFLQRSNNNYRE